MKKLRIFAASPSDTAAERAKVKTVAEQLKPLADALGIVLDVDDWSEVVPDMGRPQQVILDQLKPTSWDVFIGILWHRFGTAPGDKDPQTQKAYLSGTEEEFNTAYRLWKQSKKPRILMYRCTRAVLPDSLDPDQFKRVKEFFKQFDAVTGEHPGLPQSFDTTEAFETLVFDNLMKLVLEYGEQIKGAPVPPEVVQEFAPKLPDNLPRRAPFFGRDKEMETVLRALGPDDRTWGVLLDGIGGIGKTALAVEAAYRVKEKGLFDAFILVSAKQNILDPSGIRELTPVARTVDEFLNETVRVLGQPGIAKLEGDDKRRSLLDAMRGKRILLIYDNLETLAKGEQEALADFLRQMPSGCKAITTSRKRGGEGAVWLRLERLEWEAARKIIETEIERDSQLADKLPISDESRWQDLFDATGGSPLALVHTLGLMRVRVTLTLDGALELLGSDYEDLQRFIFQEARHEMTTNDEAALRALSFFSPSATFEAWVEVSELPRKALETCVDRLNALSLVDLLPGEDRYALHPLTRNYVRDELLKDLKIANETGIRFVRFWLAYGNRFGGSAKDHYHTFNLIDAEWSNFDAVSEWLWQTLNVRGEKNSREICLILGELAVALGGASGPLFFSGRWDESLRLNKRAFEALRGLNNSREAGWRAYTIAWVYHHRNDIDEASRWAECSLKAWEGESDQERAEALRLLAGLALSQHDYARSEELLQQALGIFRERKMTRSIGQTLFDLGKLRKSQEKYDEAEGFFEQALLLAKEDRDKEGEVIILVNMGTLACDRKQWERALKLLEHQLPLVEELDRDDLTAVAKAALARVYEALGNLDRALTLAQEALTVEERLQKSSATLEKLVERLKEQSVQKKSAVDSSSGD
jgi:tetratricopeptide (TPR) repeat protein